MLADVPEDMRPRAPTLPAWLAFVWRCFHRLKHDRPMLPRMEGEPVPGRIPWALVMAWADRHGLTDAEAELLDFGVQVLDDAFGRWWVMDQQRKREGGGRGA
jgi:hypothetical protein